VISEEELRRIMEQQEEEDFETIEGIEFKKD